MINLKIIFEKLLNQSNFSKSQVLYIDKLIKVVIICQNKHFIFLIFLDIASSYQRFNSSYKLNDIFFVLSFNQNLLS